jgi:sec-independent protein translocase protein TatA
LILVVALIVFGPKKLPEIGSAIGKGLREFRQVSTELTQELTREIQLDEKPKEETEQPKSTSPAAVEQPQSLPPEAG